MKYFFPILFFVLTAFGAGCDSLSKPAPPFIACTMEAKVCPDGSSVGRSGPTCEFSACPPLKADTTTPSGDFVSVATPALNALVKSPLTVTGEASGSWYFEAQFPVKVYDANGKLLGSSPAKAQAEWMTDQDVPFIATVPFSSPTTATGTLVLEKDNPSGLPEHDAQLVHPVIFSTATSTTVQ